MGRQWSMKEDIRLRSLLDAGWTQKQAAAQLGRNIVVVCRRANKLGLGGKKRVAPHLIGFLDPGEQYKKPRVEEGKSRKCLKCGMPFISFGNRLCEECHRSNGHFSPIAVGVFG